MKAEQPMQNPNVEELTRINKTQSDIFNSIPAGLVILDNDGNILTVNEEWRKFAAENGIEFSNTFEGKNYISVLRKCAGSSEETVDLILSGILSVQKGEKEIFSLDYSCNTPTSNRWFRAQVQPLNKNRNAGVIIMHTEITENKKTEEEMKLLINNTEESFVLIDKDLRIVSFNNQFYNLYKKYFKLEVRHGASILDFAQPERKEIVAQIYKNVLQGNFEISEIKIPLSEDNVKVFSLKFNPAKDKSGNIFGVFVTAADITDKKQAELLKEFEKRDKEALINSTDDLIWSVTSDFKLIAANNSFLIIVRTMTGKTLKPGDDLLADINFPSEYLVIWKKLYQKALNGKSFKTEIFTRAEIGKYDMWTETSFNPIFSENTVVAIACYSRNITERKEVEQTIIRNEALLAESQKLAKLGSWDFDFKADKLNWSEELYNIFGIDKDSFQLTHDSFVKLIDEEFRAPVMKNCINTQLTGESFTIEYTITLGSGEQKIIQERGYGKKNENGIVDRMFGTAQDITERKHAEEKLINTSIELQRALNDLNKVMDSSLDVICAVNEDGYFVKVSAACLAVWGYKQEELIGKQIWDFIYHEDHDKTLVIANKVMEGNNISHFENRYVRKDGTIVPISWAVRWDPVDRIRYGVARDISDQVAYNKKIEENEARLNEAQALAKVGNWETDLTSLNVTWSAETFRIFEVDAAEFKSSHPAFLEYVHSDDVERVNKSFNDSFETKGINVIEHRIITPKGNLKFLEERWQISRDKNNVPIRAVGTCQDITERKIAELERIKITNDLIQRNRDLEQFAFIISHNLRAPTANIIGFSDNLLNESLSKQEEKELLKGLSISVNRLDSVIKDLNKILQVRREIEGEKEVISLPGLINDISISIENIIEKNNVQINTDFSGASEMYSLKSYLHSIFFNLISNSIKYRHPDIDPIISIVSKKENGKIKVTFKDNGSGIDLGTKGDKIFGLYKRFHSHIEGKGLGLFMVKTQVEALGGTISVQSEINHGTQFTIVFE